jgi:hypothetical protein
VNPCADWFDHVNAPDISWKKEPVHSKRRLSYLWSFTPALIACELREGDTSLELEEEVPNDLVLFSLRDLSVSVSSRMQIV